MTNKTILNLAFLLAVLLIAASCAGTRSDGDVVTETRSAHDFHEINVEVPGKVVLHTGPKYLVEVQAEESVMPYLETAVKNGELCVYFSRSVYDVDDLRVDVTAPAFDKIRLSGSGDLLCDEPMDGSDLSIDVSGSGDVLLNDVLYEHVELEVSGSGGVELRGKAEHSLDYRVSGSGDVDGTGCPSPRVTARVSGSGSVSCHALDQLRAIVSGSGNVWYLGNPKLDTEISGSGKVRKL
ncbi:MAG TPA: head GIN domain-containing protein [Saprospiraceae bacterium]|nr:head GIN domain-containing protein [Saprospiraceae bacterium]